MKVGDVGCYRPARVDEDDLQSGPPLLGRGEALVQHGMAPGEVGADEDHEVGSLEVLIGPGHRIGAEGATVAGDGGRHAQARIGVDVGRADEALHQLVRDVIVLGEELARDVEGDGVRPVLRDGLREGRGDEVEGVVPPRAASVRYWDVAGDPRGRSSRRAPSPWSRAGRDWRDGRGRQRLRPSPPAATVATTPHPTPQ